MAKKTIDFSSSEKGYAIRDLMKMVYGNADPALFVFTNDEESPDRKFYVDFEYIIKREQHNEGNEYIYDNKLHIVTKDFKQAKEWRAIGLKEGDPQETYIPKQFNEGSFFFTVDFNDPKQYEIFSKFLLERAVPQVFEGAAKQLDEIQAYGKILDIPMKGNHEKAKAQLKKAANEISTGQSRID